MPKPVGQKISEKVVSAIEPQIEKVSQSIFGGIKKGVQEYLSNQESLGNKIAKNIISGWRFLTGETIIDPQVVKNYPLLYKTIINLTQLPLYAKNVAGAKMKNIFGHLGDNEEKIRQTLGVVSDLNKLRDKLFDYSLVSKEDLTPEIENLKRKITFLNSGQLQALKNVFRDNKAKLIEMEEREGRRITLETIYDKSVDSSLLYGYRLSKDKGYVSKIENIFRNILDDPEIKIEHIYFPEISPEYARIRYGVSRLTPILKPSLKERVGFYEKARHLSMWKEFDDPIEAYQFFQTQYEFDRNFNKLLREALSDYDILRTIKPEEMRKLYEYVGNHSIGKLIKREELEKLGLKSVLEKLPQKEDGVVFFTLTSGPQTNYFSKKEKMLLELISEGMTEDQLKSLGIQKRVFLLPTSYHRSLEDYLKVYGGVTGWAREVEKVFPSIRGPLTFWKRLVTLYLGGVPFQVMNFIGDMYRMFSFAPEATTKLVEAARLLNAYLGGNLDKLGARYTKEQLKNRIKILEQTSYSFVDFLSDPKTPFFRSMRSGLPRSIFDIPSWLDDTLQFIYQYRESIPKLATALYNIERVEKGLLPVFRGAPEYIKKTFEAGYIYDAISAHARYVTVDYAAMNPAFRRIFSNALAPFAFWYVRNFKSLLDYSIQTRGLAPLIFYVAPIAALYLYNHRDGDPKALEYEQRLPDWVKYSLHINLNISPSVQKALNLKQDIITVNFQTPWDIAAQFLGIDKIWKLYEQWRDKKITDEFFKDSLAGTLLLDVPTRTTLNLLNPVIKAFVDIRANRDSFSGRKIVPDHLVDTPQATNLKVAHILNSISLTPLIPMMGATNQQDIENILEDVDQRGLDKNWKVALRTMGEVLKKPLDIKKSLLIRDYDWSNMMRRDVYEAAEVQKRNFESYAAKTLEALLKQDFETFNKRIDDVKQGNVPGVELELLAQYFARPTTIKQVLKRVAALKLPPEKRKQVEQLLNLFDVQEKIRQTNKAFRNQTMESIQEYLDSLSNQ